MISIIVPIYNVEKYLSKCLDSIRNQTFTDFEVLMINDGSTDNSAKIAQSFLTDSRFHLISKPNGGQGQARNVGIDNASGDFICFIDSDDFIDLDYLKVLIGLLTENNADIAQCGVNRVWENGRVLPYSYTGLTSAVYTDMKKYLRDSSFVMCNKLFRRNLFNNLRYPEGIKFEDFALAPQVYERANVIVSTDKCLYNYFWRNNSTTTAVRIQPDILKAYKVLEESDFGKRHSDIMQSYFIRQVMCSLLWAMIYDSCHIDEVKCIMSDGLSKYVNWGYEIDNAKINRIQAIWARTLIKGHFRLAHFYVRTYESMYAFIRNIYHIIRK